MVQGELAATLKYVLTGVVLLIGAAVLMRYLRRSSAQKRVCESWLAGRTKPATGVEAVSQWLFRRLSRPSGLLLLLAAYFLLHWLLRITAGGGFELDEARSCCSG